ncbi:PepSY-associated TM helix domain-containing protein [Duganella radicis]|uniref:PepSY-associated TM helix domain-containing protein n=1 Tax=Duganella radicis TaxID=551988 RepID=UPI001E4DB7C9|nr:PepSY-associated TM helix domain-containing protein [Duganella radicis]
MRSKPPLIRWLQVLIGVPAAWLLSALAVGGIGAALAWSGMARPEAVVLGAMLGFVIMPMLVLWGFRNLLVWLHTWAGVVLGGVLFAVFWMGSLSVFDREIDRWMMPATRLPPAPQQLSLDRIAAAVTPVLPPKTTQWRVDLPTERVPVLRLTYKAGADDAPVRQLDPATLTFLPEPGSKGGSGFIFPFHYGLHLGWNDLGKWIVGLAAMAMLVLLVSGVIIHKKIFVQFFTFRPHKSLQRGTLDLHNLTGVLGLPFHFVMTLSGLIIFITIYFPQAHWSVFGSGKEGKAAFTAEAYGKFSRPKAKAPGTLASLDGMVARAEQEWAGGRPYFVRVWHPGDANSYVELRRSYARDVTMNLDQIYFDAGSGAILNRFEAGSVMTVQRFISGIHFIQFQHWPLRWLYFLAGLSGCTLIATGFLFWLEARRVRHARKNLAGVPFVEGLATGAISGVMLATLALLAANRLLPADASWGGEDRATLEMWAFFLTWLLSFVHAWLRRRAAWREQAWAISAGAVACVLLNAITTADHLLRAASEGMWAVAGVDLMLLTAAVIAACAARRMAAKRASATTAAAIPATSAAPAIQAVPATSAIQDAPAASAIPAASASSPIPAAPAAGRQAAVESAP